MSPKKNPKKAVQLQAALRVELQAAPLSPRPLALRAAQEQALDQVQALEAAHLGL